MAIDISDTIALFINKYNTIGYGALKYIDERGNEFLVGYYPPMFHGAYQIRNEGNKMNLNSREMPAKVYYEMTSEDGNAHILFITGSVYHHIDNIPANASKQNTISADLRRYRSFIGADAFADLRFKEEHPTASNISVIKVEEGKIFITDSCEFKPVHNGIIKNGVWVPSQDGTITIEGGIIMGGTGTNNGGKYEGGAIKLNADTVFTLNGGTICGNIANYGAGIYISGNIIINAGMTGGSICYNKADNGGGVYIKGSSNKYKSASFPFLTMYILA